MKLITADLECSHSAEFEAESIPVQPNHKHLSCATCGGGFFSAVRITGVEEIIGRVVVAADGTVRVSLDPTKVDPNSDLGHRLADGFRAAGDGCVFDNGPLVESPVVVGNIPAGVVSSAGAIGSPLKLGDTGFGVVASAFKPTPEARTQP